MLFQQIASVIIRRSQTKQLKYFASSSPPPRNHMLLLLTPSPAKLGMTREIKDFAFSILTLRSRKPWQLVPCS